MNLSCAAGPCPGIHTLATELALILTYYAHTA
eukprot:SAG25_NODE_7889_length_451_cov_1.431818_1_plen_31_part_10